MKVAWPGQGGLWAGGTWAAGVWAGGGGRDGKRRTYSRPEQAHNQQSIKLCMVDDDTHTRMGGDHVPTALLACSHYQLGIEVCFICKVDI